MKKREYEYFERRCAICQELFTYIRRGTRYCSNACRALGYRKRHARNERNRRRREQLGEVADLPANSGLLVPTEARVPNPGGYKF